MSKPRPTAVADRTLWFEGFVLLGAAPFLLFPDMVPVLTLLALLALVGVWLRPWVVPAAARTAGLPVTPFNLAMLVWLLALLVSILVSADPALTLPKATGLILATAVWRFLTLFACTERRVGWGAWGFLLLGVGLTLFGILSADWPAELPIVADLVGLLPSALIALPGGRAEGTHTNELAAVVGLYLPLAVSLLAAGSVVGRWQRAGAGLVALFAGGTLLLTQSRSGMLGTAVALMTLLLLWGLVLPPSRTRRRARMAFGVLAVLGGAALVLLWPTLVQLAAVEPPEQTIIGSLSTINYRREVWPWGVQALRDFPLTGTGLGTFRVVVQRLYPIAMPPTVDIAHAHNQFLQVGLDMGLVGLVAYGALLLVSTAVAWQAARRSARLRPITLGLLAGLVALHVYGVTDALAPGAKPGVLLWTGLGLLTAVSTFALSRKSHPVDRFTTHDAA